MSRSRIRRMVTDRTTPSSAQAGNETTLLSRLRIVLVGTTHPGNIGAAARAMKAMGLTDLALVEPTRFPAAEATAMASGADDVLARAEVTSGLDEALRGCSLVFGTTARERHISWPLVTPREAAALAAASTQRVALVFGRERSGLTNEELDRCQRAVTIPTDASFSSLNLAQAVQICAYEMRLAHVTGVQRRTSRKDRVASAVEIAAAKEHALSVMVRVSYFDPDRPKLLERRLQRMLSRGRLMHSDVQILRGFLSAVETSLTP